MLPTIEFPSRIYQSFFKPLSFIANAVHILRITPCFKLAGTRYGNDLSVKSGIPE